MSPKHQHARDLSPFSYFLSILQDGQIWTGSLVFSFTKSKPGQLTQAFKTLGAGRHSGLTWDGLRRRIRFSLTWCHLQDTSDTIDAISAVSIGESWFLPSKGGECDTGKEAKKKKHILLVLGQLGDHELSVSSRQNVSPAERL